MTHLGEPKAPLNHAATNRRRRTGRLLLLTALLLLLPTFATLASTGTTSAPDPARAGRPSAAGRPAQGKASTPHIRSFRNTDPKVAYVGSKACEGCHQAEYQNFLKTPHAQSATLAQGRTELKKLPSDGVTVCQNDGVTCFRVAPAKDGYVMSQFDRGADGSEMHPETEKIAFALGTPLIATGYVVQRGDFLFEAPLTYYTKPFEGQVQGWGISPGYGNDAVGFTRPVVASCLTCHVGQLRSTDASSNRYQSPAFGELAIGCESCHGPGALHVKERQAALASHASLPEGVDSSIVNPKHLSAELADETCMYCHELGQARVPLPGKSFQDYRPGVPLLRTEAIFKSKLLLGWNLEEWSDEMATSACYRFSNGALRCSTCHDPHLTPSAEEAPALYRTKCLTCHQETGSSRCTLPLSERQHTQPADNCITCHMPQHVAPKLVKIGGRGTSHRILKTEDEPIPEMDTPQTAADPATGLILVDSDSHGAQTHLPRAVLLSGYQGVLARDPSRDDLANRYRSLLEEMAGDHSAPLVLSALAGGELARRTSAGDQQAIKDLAEAVDLDSKFPKDYLLLSDLQFRSGNPGPAIKVLWLATERFPYNPAPYEHLVASYMRTGDKVKAAEVLHRGLELFPADRNLCQLAAKMGQP
jgi:hypothetical protein